MVKQKNHMDQHNKSLSVIEDKGVNEQEAVRDYVDGLENNIQWWQEQCAIYQTQKELAQAKVRRLELQLFQCMQTKTQ